MIERSPSVLNLKTNQLCTENLPVWINQLHRESKVNYYKSVHTYILDFAKDTFKLKFQANFQQMKPFRHALLPPPSKSGHRSGDATTNFFWVEVFVPSCLHSIAQSTGLSFFTVLFSLFMSTFRAIFLKIKSVLFSF